MSESKIFNDPVHGHIEFDPLLVEVIDTPQFQRLRHIKQLGTCYWVYPSSTHNRFEHSLGTCYLASRLVQSLKSGLDKDLGIEITDKDIFLVSLAALCHDLGHGPLSHAFDGRFLRMLNLNKSHEDLSVEMLDRLLKENDIINLFRKRFPDFEENDLEFVREQIRGPKKDNIYIGLKDPRKRFLYDIVSNKESGVDVDKFDYIARDCHHLGIKSTFDHWRYIQFAKVIKDAESYKICTREKEARNIYELFHMRLILHDRAYQHKTCNAIEMMMIDALYQAKDHIKITLSDGREIKLVEAINIIEAYEQLTDNIILGIRYSTDNNLKEVRQLLKRIDRRKIYRWVTEVNIKDEERVKRIVSNYLYDYKDKICYDKVNLSYGKGNSNPVDKVWFYNKSNNENIFNIKKEDVSKFLPSEFLEKRFRVYYKGVDEDEYERIKEKLITELKNNRTS